MARKEFSIEVKEDGQLAVTTGDLAGEHHVSADQFMAELAKLMGGPVEVKSTKGHHHSHTHTHSDGTVHHDH